MAERRGKRYSAGEAIEAIFADEDSNGETFDCGYDLDIVREKHLEQYQQMYGKLSVRMDGCTEVMKGLIQKKDIAVTYLSEGNILMHACV